MMRSVTAPENQPDSDRMPDCRDLALGTVQLGLPYGIANRTGQPDIAQASAIVSTAWDQGVRFYDTAQAYGTSESVLGASLAACGGGDQANIVSKLALGPGSADLLGALRGSLARLRQKTLWGVLLHNEADLDHWSGSVGESFTEARKAGLIRYAGASVYTPERALQALHCAGIDIVQVPANVFDRRMERAGVFKLAATLGKHVFIRSVYLQGLVLLSPEQAGVRMPFAGAASERLHGFCARHGVSLRHFAIEYVRRQAPRARIIIGAETAAQVSENCRQFMAAPLAEDLCEAWTEEWPLDLPELVDPRTWPTPPTKA